MLQKIDAAYEWVQTMQWSGDNIIGKWLKIFEEASNDIVKEQWGATGDMPGRNDQCPCGSGLKYKRCHGK